MPKFRVHMSIVSKYDATEKFAEMFEAENPDQAIKAARKKYPNAVILKTKLDRSQNNEPRDAFELARLEAAGWNINLPQ